MRLEYKAGVNFQPTFGAIAMVPHVAMEYRRHGLQVLTITSANDRQHMQGSKHYTNDALDFRIWDLSRVEAAKIVSALNAKLGPDYQFVLEKDHIHGEYDPR